MGMADMRLQHCRCILDQHVHASAASRDQHRPVFAACSVRLMTPCGVNACVSLSLFVSRLLSAAQQQQQGQQEQQEQQEQEQQQLVGSISQRLSTVRRLLLDIGSRCDVRRVTCDV